MSAKARIKLNAKRLYAADGRAVKELLKIAQVLYNASRANKTAFDADADTSSVPSQLTNIKGARALASDITELGYRLFDLLGKEKDVRTDRTKALRFLDAVSGNLSSSAEHDHIEKRVQELVGAMRDNIETMRKQCEEFEYDETALEAKIKRKQADLERQEKRLHSLQNVRPAFMDEYEKLEKDLQGYYDAYLERFRNLDYLEHQLDKYNQHEREKLEENDRSLKLMQKKIRDEELNLLR